MRGPHTFCFLGAERSLASRGDWNRTDWPRLWLYNVHYFDDFQADGAETRLTWHRDLVERWINENPPGAGAGWEPYPTSLRIVNWVKTYWSGRSLGTAGAESLGVQADWLSRRLEWHLLGNHLWANAKALVFAGTFFEGKRAAAWRDKGLAIIARELEEQFLPDGGHFERSPMYHAILLEDLLDLIQLAQGLPDVYPAGLVQGWRERVQDMLNWLAAMTHPDGGIAFFNDAALGIAPDMASLQAYARELGIAFSLKGDHREPRWLQASGYARINAGPAALIMDVGEIGPDYLPGHAHADTLSIELSIHGHRLFVNSGISTYDTGEERLRQRGTAAHNTLQIDGCDSSEVWSSFRVGRRARPCQVSVGLAEGRQVVSGAHDGFTWLPGRPMHSRTCRMNGSGLAVADRVSAAGHRSVVRFLLHPDWAAELHGDACGVFKRGEREVYWRVQGARSVELEGATWHPEFGKTVQTEVVVILLEGEHVESHFNWG